MDRVLAYPRHEAYKDSGVDWIGDVPAGWKIKTIKAVLTERKEKNDPIKTKNILSLCMYRGVIPYAEKGASGNKAKEDLTAYRLAYPGDIILNSMNEIRSAARSVDILRESVDVAKKNVDVNGRLTVGGG